MVGYPLLRLLWAAPLFVCAHGAALRARSRTSKGQLSSYSFLEFTREYNRAYEVGSEEYRRRSKVFEESLQRVQDINEKNAREGRSWVAGIHQFMDWDTAERKSMNGYKKSARRGGQGLSTLQLNGTGLSHGRQHNEITVSEESGGMDKGDGPQLRDQGNCGSCWAISAVEAVEAQLQRTNQADRSLQLSPQALVDCVPNPQHCGGTGGCDGATGELAYQFMNDHGIPAEEDLPYTARTQTCPNANEGAWPTSQRVRVGSWDNLPSNQAKPLMQAITEKGPVVVALDANNWFDYDSGIFDGCSKDAILGHAVLAKGYGKENGKGYWLIQNSWGSGWGEQGHIRLLRHGPEEESAWCGIDNKPKEGIGCDGGPEKVTVCGMCGLLYDPLVPQNVRLEGADGHYSKGSFVSKSRYLVSSSSEEEELLKSLDR
jgi:cathepsin L